MKKHILLLSALAFLSALSLHTQEKFRYMGGKVELCKGPNAAITNTEVLKTFPLITYTEPTTDDHIE